VKDSNIIKFNIRVREIDIEQLQKSGN